MLLVLLGASNGLDMHEHLEVEVEKLLGHAS